MSGRNEAAAFETLESPAVNSPIVTSDDFFALRSLDCEPLQQELDRATVVPAADAPSDVVTMHASVLYLDESTGVRRRVTIVYPDEADAASGRISILAPVGVALLGLAPGESIDWEMPHRGRCRLRVIEVARRSPRPRD